MDKYSDKINDAFKELLIEDSNVYSKKDEQKNTIQIDESNESIFSWDQLNTAMMNAGFNPRSIFKVVSALKGKGTGTGNSATYKWEDINKALMSVSINAPTIAKVLHYLK